MDSVISTIWFLIKKRNERFEFRGAPQSTPYLEPTRLVTQYIEKMGVKKTPPGLLSWGFALMSLD